MKNIMNKVRNSKGFTLIELIVVVGIIGILVGIAQPRFVGFTKDANVATLQADARVLSDAALIYNIENDGAWPATNAVDGAKKVHIGADDTDGTELMVIDADAIGAKIKNTKNPVEKYGIVTSGKLAGEVFHLEGTLPKDAEDAENDEVKSKVYGVNLEAVVK